MKIKLTPKMLKKIDMFKKDENGNPIKNDKGYDAQKTYVVSCSYDSIPFYVFYCPSKVMIPVATSFIKAANYARDNKSSTKAIEEFGFRNIAADIFKSFNKFVKTYEFDTDKIEFFIEQEVLDGEDASEISKALKTELGVYNFVNNYIRK